MAYLITYVIALLLTVSCFALLLVVFLQTRRNIKVIPLDQVELQLRSEIEITIMNMAYWKQASAETDSVDQNCYYIQKTVEANNKLRALLGDYVPAEEIVLPAHPYPDCSAEDLPTGVIDLATQRELRSKKNPPDSLW